MNERTRSEQRQERSGSLHGAHPGTVHVSDVYFSLKTLSTYAGLSVRRLRGYLTDRTWPLPFYRIGGKILVRRSDFDMWAAHFRRDTAGVDVIVDDIMKGL